MALAVSAIRQALAQTLETAYGSEVQIATAPDQITPPCIYIGMPSITYHTSSTRAGIDEMELSVWGIMPRISDQAAVDLFDELMSGAGDRSLLTIVEEDQTLGGACQTLLVRSALAELWPGTTALPAARWTIGVWG